ncbi:MAG: 3-deoxy-D-manno-octulosonic acid transferase [Candidatus Omnitrophota bacterium]|nr:3-deoxy-D-manno-octulosonic acid transferase [Candidatus Omnitrophota bacterium]
MFIIYDLVFLIVILIHLPLYLLRKKFRHGLPARVGVLPKGLDQKRPIWIHAVSVGEAVMVKGLVLRLKEMFPGRRFVISTVTATGNKIVRSFASGNDFVTYLPFDFSFIVRSVIDRVDPSLFIIAETELWPNLIRALRKKNIPVVVVNGRISDGSFRGYSAIKFLLRPVLAKVNLFCVQGEMDKSRLVSLGVAPGNISVTGNMKFDSAVFKIDAGELVKSRGNLSLVAADKLWVCGSTRSGEEEMILAAYKVLLVDFPGLKLLIAPRHPDRVKEVEKLVCRYSFTPLRISRLYERPLDLVRLRSPQVARGKRTTNECEAKRSLPEGDERRNPRSVFILDTVGELINYYAIADIVFVGGSLVKTGGHNFLEPAMLEKPILCGPHMFNFRDLAALFLKNQAFIMVKDRESLAREMKRLLNDPAVALALGCRARALILKNQGAVERNIQCLRQYIS